MKCVARLTVVAIISTIFLVSSAQGDSSLQASVERRITVTESKTIFTLFCLLNLGGYDEENNPAGMHPVRVRVRQQLARDVPSDLAQRIRDFYRLHKGATPEQYSVVAMSTSGPPDFQFTGEEWPEVKKNASFGSLEGVAPLLRELYAKAAIEKIYAGVQPDYRAYIDAYRAGIVTQVSKVMAYCKVSTLGDVAGGSVQRALVIPNLLESYDRAFGFVLSNTVDSIDGPHEKIGFNPHEFVHSITSSMSYDPQYKMLQEPARPLYDLAKTIPDIGDVESLQNFLDENLVRAIALKYLDNGEPERSRHLQEVMMQEYRSGYVLERFFYGQLAEYEKSGLPLAAYYPTMLKGLDVNRELARWKQEKATSR